MPSEIFLKIGNLSQGQTAGQLVFLSSVDFGAFEWIIANEHRRKDCMKSARFLVALSTLLLIPPNSVVAKGEGAGIYAIVDQVTFEPEGDSPNFVRISGVFVVPPLPIGSYRSCKLVGYMCPRRGYLYFRITPGTEAATRRDWSELRAVAGSGKVVAFGEYWVPNPDDPQGNPHHSLEVTVHAEGDSATPEVYPISVGVMKAVDMVHSPNHPLLDKIAAQLQEASHR